MKLKITLLALVFTSFFYGQTTAIPDTNFEQALVDLNIDSNGMNGNILNSDAQAVTSLDVSSKNISTLTGIEAFVNLETFYASSNALTTINVTNNTLLEDLRVNNNSLTTLDISNNINVSILWAHFNNINTIDLTNNGALSELFLAFNRVTTFDATNLPNLTRLGISNGQAGFKLNSLNVQNNPLLNHLSIQGSELTSLNLSNNNLIKYLLISNNLLSGNLDLANMSNLIDFSAENNDFESINLKNSNNTNLSGVDVTNNPNLTCIQVDDVSYANAQSQWIKDATASYSTACSTLGLDDKNINLDFKLYPNPTFNTVNIETPHTIRSLKLTNINGQVIFETKTALNKMDLTAYNAGIYFISIETDKGVSTKKIVKQ